MKKNDDDRIFLINMWNKVSQLERNAQITAQHEERRQLKRQRIIEFVLVTAMILTTMILILMNAGLTTTILSQSVLILLCLIMDLTMKSGGKANHDRSSSH